MLDIYSRVSIIAGEAIPDTKVREEFLRQFSLILKDYSISEMSTELAVYDQSDIELCKMFIGIKAVEGCTKGTLRAYSEGLRMLRLILQKPLKKATANDIRCALAIGMTKRKWSSETANNYRRFWSTFYTWAFNEHQIDDNPMRQVKAIKGKRNVRMPFSEEEMEKLRNATNASSVRHEPPVCLKKCARRWRTTGWWTSVC